ncbi:MAG: hypothetical protein LC648_01680 [Novosphingobium sp.]|nr:hypothetical protein [Novosphingobium sp.]
MRLRYFAPALSAASLLSFAAAACSERAAESDVPAEAAETAEPAPPVESSALPADALPATPPAQSPSPTY